MISFNLLPTKYREELKKDSFSRIFNIFAVFSLFWTLIIGTLLVAGIFFLSIQNEVLEERVVSMQNMKETEEVEEVEENIIRLNNVLAKINAIEKDRPHNIGVVLSKIAPLAPNGISINNFNFDAKTNIVLISGHADLRTQVITFKDRLEEEPLFEEVESPLSNLLQSSDVNFKFTITLQDKDEKRSK